MLASIAPDSQLAKVSIATVVDGFISNEAIINAKITEAYNKVANDTHYAGGWSGKPDFTEETYQRFNTWLVSGKDPISNPQACIIASNKLWQLVDILTAHAQFETSQSLGLRINGADNENQQLVSGGTLTFQAGERDEDIVRVYSGKCRMDLSESATYADKYIEIIIGNKNYRMRAVDTKESDAPISSLNRLSLDPSEQALAQVEVIKALRVIQTAVESGNVSFQVELFDRGITPVALKNLMLRMTKTIRD